MKSNQEVIDLMNILGNIKNLRRTGWLKRNVSCPESDADHCFSVAVMTLLLANNELDKDKCLKMALLHDLPEVYCGDYTPCDDISAEDKYIQEFNAAQRLSKELNYPEIMDLFVEFEEQKTPEAKFVKALDKLDNAITAKYYDTINASQNNLFEEFGSNAKKNIIKINPTNTDELVHIIDILKKL